MRASSNPLCTASASWRRPRVALCGNLAPGAPAAQTPRERCARGVVGLVSRCRSAGGAHGRPAGWRSAQCQCLPCVLQKPKLKPGKSLPLGVEELGQLPPAEGRQLRKSFRRGEGRSGPQR